MQAQRKVARQQQEREEEVAQEVEVVATFEELQEVEEYRKKPIGFEVCLVNRLREFWLMCHDYEIDKANQSNPKIYPQ